MNSVICSAIQKRRQLKFVYNGHPRVVEPHRHGWSSEDSELLSGYQVGGSSSTDPEDWKTFTVEKMSEIEEGAKFTGTRPGYNRNTTQMKSVHCELPVPMS